MLLVVSVASVLVAGTIGYIKGRDSLRDAAFAELTAVREARARELTRFYESTLDALVIYTRGDTATAAAAAFTEGFGELADSTVTVDQRAELEGYYEEVFVPQLAAASDVDYDSSGFFPESAAQRYLQANYTAPFDDDFDAILATDDAGDGSAWSAAHARYHDYFREFVQRFDYEDAAAARHRGQCRLSGLRRRRPRHQHRHRARSPAPISRTPTTKRWPRTPSTSPTVTDFGRYQPSYGVPTAWAVSPIGSERQSSTACWPCSCRSPRSTT